MTPRGRVNKLIWIVPTFITKQQKSIELDPQPQTTTSTTLLVALSVITKTLFVKFRNTVFQKPKETGYVKSLEETKICLNAVKSK